MGWQLIESQSLSASAASVTFSSIPQTYKTLKLLVSSRDDFAQVYGNLRITFNGSATSYSGRLLQGNGATATSSTNTTTEIEGLSTGSTATSNTFSSVEVTVPNYTGSTNKPVSVDVVTETNGTTAYQRLNAVLWSNSAAITSIGVAANSGSNLLQFGSTFTLYGLA